jgi:hypothetical protein
MSTLFDKKSKKLLVTQNKYRQEKIIEKTLTKRLKK